MRGYLEPAGYDPHIFIFVSTPKIPNSLLKLKLTQSFTDAHAQVVHYLGMNDCRTHNSPELSSQSSSPDPSLVAAELDCAGIAAEVVAGVAPLPWVLAVVTAAPDVSEEAAALSLLLLVPLAVPEGLPQPLPPAIGVQLYVSFGSKSSIGGELVLSRTVSYAPLK